MPANRWCARCRRTFPSLKALVEHLNPDFTCKKREEATS